MFFQHLFESKEIGAIGGPGLVLKSLGQTNFCFSVTFKIGEKVRKECINAVPKPQKALAAKHKGRRIKPYPYKKESDKNSHLKAFFSPIKAKI